MAPNKEKRYVSDNAQLMAEWDWEKNIESPYSITYGSAKKCHWKCSICGHKWEAPAYSRGSNNCGCPLCAQKNRGDTRRKSSAKKNSFLFYFPEIAKEWHPTKNEKYKIEEISSFSNIKAWWLCSECGNEWFTTVNHRTKEGNGCPICSKSKAAIEKVKFHAKANNFAIKYPDLAKEWHPTKNADLTANNVSVSSNKKVWWQCSFCGNEWESTISHRTSGRGCPKCSKAGTSKCEQIIYYYVQKSFPDAVNRYFMEYEFDIFIPSKNIAIEYDGLFFHKSKEKLEKDNKKDVFCQNNKIKLIRFRSSRLKDTSSAQRITCEDYEIEKGIQELFLILNTPCPNINIDRDTIKILNNFRALTAQKSIIEMHPDVAKEWHPIKNENIPINSVLPMSNIKFWWKCSICGYEWMDTPNHRCGRNSGCPLCAGKVVVAGVNDLGTQHPNVAKEWNYKRNGDITPEMITAGSNKKVWWKCNKGHEWEAVIRERTATGRATNCPYCVNKKVLKGFNDLSTTHPHLAMEWSEKNSITPSEVTYGSNKKAWWKCNLCNHEWVAFVYSRSQGQGCPVCASKKRWDTRKKKSVN